MARPQGKTDAQLIKIAEKYLRKVEIEIENFDVRNPPLLPTTEELSIRCGLTRDGLADRAKNCEELFRTIEMIKSRQSYLLQQLGLSERWNPGMAKFLLSANHGMAEQSKVGGIEGSPLLAAGTKIIIDGNKDQPNEQTEPSVQPPMEPGS